MNLGMANKNKSAKSKYDLVMLPLVFVVLAVFGILGQFISLLSASVVGLVITVSIFFFMRSKVKSEKPTDEERLAYTVAYVCSIFLLLSVLILGWLYLTGNTYPQLLNIGFPTAQQASSIFNISLVAAPATLAPGMYTGTGRFELLADAERNYSPSSNPLSYPPYITVIILQFNKSSEAEMYYNGTASPYTLNDTINQNGSKYTVPTTYIPVTGSYRGLTYAVFSTYGVAYLGNYTIQIIAFRHLNQSRTINFLENETDIIQARS
jgi:hypothetical protein